MEEASLELRNAIHLALSVDDVVANAAAAADHHRYDGDMPNNNNDARSSSEEGTLSYVSSLSGSLPQPASEQRTNNSQPHTPTSRRGGGGVGCSRARWQARRLRAATRVEAAASDYESALLLMSDDHHHEQRDLGSSFVGQQGEESIVDFLVASLTSVPRTLLMRRVIADTREDIRDQRRELDYHSSMGRICYNIACIASDVLRKHFMGTRYHHHDALEDRHVYDMIDEVVHLCNADPSANDTSNLHPILGLLNSLSEEQDFKRSIYECEHGGDDDVDEFRTGFFLHLSSRESLRLIHILMNRFVCDHDGECDEASSHIGYFVGYLLKHFAYVVRGEVGCISLDECSADLFGAWTLGIDEHMVRRLNEDEAREIHALIARYHVISIQSALHLIENVESVVGGYLLESETVDGAPESNVAALRDAVRSIAMIVDTAEAMDELRLGHDPEIHVIFHPLMSSYARFVGSCLHDAFLFSRSAYDGTRDVENVTILADNLLFRLCRVAVGMEALKSPSFREADDVLALTLLRAVNYPCIAGGAGFLLDVAADRARVADSDVATSAGEPIPKRRRRAVSGLGGGRSPDVGRVDMTDVILACLALSLSNQQDEEPDPSCSKRASRIASALLLGHEKKAPGNMKNHRTAMDPLNPWHTIQARRMQGLASLCDDDGNPHDASWAYVRAIPHLFDTKNL